MNKRVYILTERRYLAPMYPSAYEQQILDEESILSLAFAAKGIDATRVDWSDPKVDWEAADAAIFRSTWDYFDRFEEFKDWIGPTSKKIRFINPYETIFWNMDKHYLIDLEKKGVPIVPSRFIEIGSKDSLASLCAKEDWNEFILKPCVSGTARHTYRFNRSGIAEHEAILKQLIQKEGMMLQEFHTSIMERGEVSHMVMGGKYSHSILKTVKTGEFRVQDDFGGTVKSYEANEEEIAFAEKSIKTCDPIPLYGRVDVMWGKQGELMLTELELVEPELWFRIHPGAADLLAEAVRSFLNKR
jgi:glutathione synthase/RimK-type ligase-like ATP-grasp enzyme